MKWKSVIGLEVHAQVISNSKLFSAASTNFGEDPNTNVDYLDIGMPGVLPVVNEECVNQAIKTGLGLGSTINQISVFDRKNYFYADLPLGYQISQNTHPIVSGGYIDLDELDEPKRIRITRLHLEQDAGKSIHDLNPKYSYIDLNRAGVALMEIVSEPDISNAQEAMLYVKKLRNILRYLGTCDGDMEKGNLRVDVNISIHKQGEPLGTRAEIKNLNSIKHIGQAIEYEIKRQIELLEEGKPVIQETRLFDSQKMETRAMRSKENAYDYRYFPDPDLKPLVLTFERIKAIELTLPELPEAKKNRFIKDYGLSAYDASVLCFEQKTANYYETVVGALVSKDEKAPKIAANWLIVEVFGAMNRNAIQNMDDLPFAPHFLAELIDLILDNTISGKIGKEVFAKLWETGCSPKQLVNELGLTQISDPKTIDAAIDDVIQKHPQQLEQYRSGQDKLFGFFVGQVMKKLAGKADPGLVNEKLKQKL
jgi:aspartyl-tRNA(Asn)/glutamyl-tRNA(Gln) amidotransferase subunit B